MRSSAALGERSGGRCRHGEALRAMGGRLLPRATARRGRRGSGRFSRAARRVTAHWPQCEIDRRARARRRRRERARPRRMVAHARIERAAPAFPGATYWPEHAKPRENAYLLCVSPTSKGVSCLPTRRAKQSASQRSSRRCRPASGSKSATWASRTAVARLACRQDLAHLDRRRSFTEKESRSANHTSR